MPDDPAHEEETCWDCGGEGCSTCNDTGELYTANAIRLQIEREPGPEEGEDG